MSELVVMSGTKSVVWDNFGLECGTDGKVVKDSSTTCRTCRKRVLAKHGNTSNLLAHLKMSHPSIYVEAKSAMDAEGKRPARDSVPVPAPAATQLTFVQSMTASQKYGRKGRKWKELLPIYTVEKSGFQCMLNKFDARCEVPSQTYFSRTAIPTLYASVKEQVKQELSTVQYFSAATDLWSSIGTKPYMSYTMHFVNEEWKLRTRCLQAQFLPDDHTGENLAEAIEEMLAGWDLNAKNQVCLPKDNGTNNINAAECLDWTWLSCFGHNLHLAITKALKNDCRCEQALAVFHKVVSALSWAGSTGEIWPKPRWISSFVNTPLW